VFVEQVGLLSVSGYLCVRVLEDGLVCLWCICVLIVEASNELPEFGRVGVECDSVEYLFPFVALFLFDILGDLSV